MELVRYRDAPHLRTAEETSETSFQITFIMKRREPRYVDAEPKPWTTNETIVSQRFPKGKL